MREHRPDPYCNRKIRGFTPVNGKTFFLIFMALINLYAYTQNYLFDDTFDILGEWNSINGRWIIKDGALVQKDSYDRITHISRIVKQEGVMEYEFECFYITGLKDNYGGFGIHICINKPTSTRSWGMNRSFLFWITYDPAAYKRRDCFFLQVYKSTSPIHMDFLHNDKGDKFPLDPAILSPKDFKATAETGEKIRFKIRIDTGTGKGRFYHPGIPDLYYPFDLKTMIEPGMYISFRTNSISIGIDYLTVRMIE